MIVQHSERSSLYDKENIRSRIIAAKDLLGNAIPNESQDISLHLKNLINFCNQSIQKKETCHTKTTEESKIIEPKVKTLNLLALENQENDNPETARFH